jgi:hypothetical protein
LEQDGGRDASITTLSKNRAAPTGRPAYRFYGGRRSS